MGLLSELKSKAQQVRDVLLVPAQKRARSVSSDQTEEDAEGGWSSPAQQRAVDDLEKSFELLQRQCAFYKRRSEEYFALIAAMEQQRDQWKRKFFDEGAAHVQAQAILESHLDRAYNQIRRSMTIIKAYRQKLGEPTPSDLVDLVGQPVELSREHQRSMDEAKASMPPQIDGQAEQRRIDAELGAPPEAAKQTSEKVG